MGFMRDSKRARPLPQRSERRELSLCALCSGRRQYRDALESSKQNPRSRTTNSPAFAQNASQQQGGTEETRCGREITKVRCLQYLYRVVDKAVHTIDFPLRARRDNAAA